MIEIPLSKRGKHRGKYIALISDEDADLAKLNWKASMSPSKILYAIRQVAAQNERKQTNLRLHRIIMERVLGRELVQDEDIDHVNGNGLDNRRENLRLATRSENCANRGKQSNNKSGYKGVHWNNEKQKWVAFIGFKRKKFYLGQYDTPEEAYEAYCEKAIELHGKFVRLS